MKLLFILPEYHREQAGGIRTFYCNLLPALAKAGCSVKVLLACRGTFDSPSYTDEAGVEVEYLRGDLFEKHSRNVAASYLAGQPTLGHYLPVGLAAHEQARGGEGFDLVELTDWPLYFLPWVCFGAKAPFTISLHSSIGQMRDFEPMPGWEMETHFIRLLEAAAFAAAPSVHTNSNLNVRYWEGITNRKVDVLLPLMANLTTKDTNAHEKGKRHGAGSMERGVEGRIAPEDGRSEIEDREIKGTTKIPNKHESKEAAACLGKPSGAAFSNPFTSELARDSENTSLISSTDGPALAAKPPMADPVGIKIQVSTGQDSGGLVADSAGGAKALDARPSSLDAAPRVRGAVFARLQNLKGAEVLCEALRLVPEVGLDWYGRTVPSADGKRTYAEDLQEKFPDVFGRQLVHHGVVSHDEALAAMRDSDFVCVPSLWDVFNLTVIEAMAQGCVVICSAKAGAEMLIEDGENGFLCDPTDANSLANALRKVHVTEQSELGTMGKRATDTIQSRFDTVRLVQERLVYYQDSAKADFFETASPILRTLLNMPEVSEKKKSNFRQKICCRMANFFHKMAKVPN